ncbi:hypothetical protein DQK91_15005 [Oceanidesulfovibrio marinus]|uniref:HAMP domain-containing protein n=2 Tax=Oceanidesulfovibrio marinus TaxID=370038 RepID=A0A6P1ZI60_9BACT|nr:hypothetical protein DQK91_15005 [Oceanidesulfovibrio marinus]
MCVGYIMSFRWKIFFIVLAFSLVPVGVVSLVNHSITESAGELISTGAANAMEDVVRNDLIQMVSNLATGINKQKQTLLFTVGVLADETQRALTEPPARVLEPIYSTQEFGNPGAAPDDATEDPVYSPPQQETTAVSRQHPVMFYADKRPMKQADGSYPADVRGLSATASLMRRILKTFPHTVFRVYITLENGLHCSLPGHAAYPEGYDPRKRPWYRRAVTTGTLVWTLPLQDVATNRMIVTASAPIRDVSGRIIGVAALDVLDTVAMGGREITDRWGSSARAFLVYPMQNPVTGAMDLQVAASQPPMKRDSVFQDDASQEDNGVLHPWLPGLKPDDKARLLDRLDDDRPGAMEVLYDSDENLLAYASSDSISFLLLVPQSVYMSLPNEVHEAVTDVTRLNILVSGAATALILIAVLLLVYFGARRYTVHFLQIADAARRLGEGDFSVRLNMHLKDERDLIVGALNEMGPKLQDHMHLRHTLAVAEEVQRNLLPGTPPRLEHFDIQGASLYCDETGGDYYDFVPVTHDGLSTMAVIVGDVSGHGVPSALLMATARALLRCLCAVPCQDMSMAQRVGLANRLLCDDVAGTGRFMTLFLLELDDANNTMRWVRGGHDPALLYHPASETLEYLYGDGVVLGVISDFQYTEHEARLDEPGDLLVLGTDGIWEARNANGDMYGKDRFEATVRANAHLDANGIFDAVITDLETFAAGTPFEDDVTLVVIKRR